MYNLFGLNKNNNQVSIIKIIPYSDMGNLMYDVYPRNDMIESSLYNFGITNVLKNDIEVYYETMNDLTKKCHRLKKNVPKVVQYNYNSSIGKLQFQIDYSRL